MLFISALLFIILLADPSLGSDTFTEKNVSNPEWMEAFTKFYKAGQITANPADIHILRVLYHHHYQFLLGGFDTAIFTLQIHGATPCNVTTAYYAGTSPTLLQDRGRVGPIVMDLCGIKSSHQ